MEGEDDKRRDEGLTAVNETPYIYVNVTTEVHILERIGGDMQRNIERRIGPCIECLTS